MSVPHVLMGLLEPGPSHGYTLKAEYDARFAGARPLRYGQVYATLARLQREGWAEEVSIEPGAGPDRRRYALTPSGIQELEQWLNSPEPPIGYSGSVLFAKTILAWASGRSATDILDAQRTVHMARMRELTRNAKDADPVGRFAIDYEIAHLDADLQWMQTMVERLPHLTDGGQR